MGAASNIDQATVDELVEALHCSVGDRLFEPWNILSGSRRVLQGLFG